MGNRANNGGSGLKFPFWILALILFDPFLRLFQVGFTGIYAGLLLLTLWHESFESIFKIAYILGILSAMPWTVGFLIWLRRLLKTWGADI
jgi:hypothetical protein